MLSHYFKIVLLPKILKNIQEDHHLNPLIITSLKKASFKPAAFYHGIINPVCNSRTSNKREAIILSSVLIRISFPKVHSIMFLLQLLKLKQHGIQIYFIKALLLKNYILPSHVISLLLNYFLSFRTEPRKLPMVWYNTLLYFLQRYKNGIDAYRKKAIMVIIKENFLSGL